MVQETVDKRHLRVHKGHNISSGADTKEEKLAPQAGVSWIMDLEDHDH